MIRQSTSTVLGRSVGTRPSLRRAAELLAGPGRVSPLPGPSERLRTTLRTKDMMDRVLGAVILVLALPVMLACCVLVRLTSRGPAIYSQQRVGQFGRVFTISKTRTMYVNCERLTGPKWCKPGDPRVTLIGGVLRALHLDELPQLVNILRGEMSLIGPRPERPEIAAKLATAIPGYDRRAVLKPGVSGFAQVHLPPDTSLQSVRNKLELDFHYIRNLSTWFDVKIMFWTGLKVFGLFRKRGLDAIPKSEG